MSSVNGNARFCTSVDPFEHDGAIGDDAEAIERGEPLVTIGEVAVVRRAENANLAFVRQRSTGDEIDHHLRPGGVDAGDRDALAGCDGKCPDAQRAQAAVALCDGGHFDDGGDEFMARRASRAAKSSAGSVERTERARPVRGFAVKVRTTGDGQAVPGGEFTVALFRVGVVIAVPDLDGSEPCAGKPRDDCVHPGHARVRQRHQPSRLLDRRDDFVGRRPGSRHVRRPVVPEQAVECVIPILRQARRHEGIGHERTSDAPPWRFRGAGEQRLDVDRTAQRAQPVGDFAEATEPIGPLSGEKGGHDAVLRIDEIRQQVHVAVLLDGGNLDPCDQPEAQPGRGAACLGDAGERIVIGDADGREPRARGARDERSGRQGAVGGGGVKVEIDQDAAADCRRGLRLGGLPGRLRRWRSTSARYSRMRRPRCARSSSANSRKICLPSESSNFSPYRLKKRCDARSHLMPIMSASRSSTPLASRSAPAANRPLAAPLKKRNVGCDSSCGSCCSSSR